MRYYIKNETDKALLVYNTDMSPIWVMRKNVYIVPNSERIGMLGTSYEIEIPKWVIVNGLEYAKCINDKAVPLF